MSCFDGFGSRSKKTADPWLDPAMRWACLFVLLVPSFAAADAIRAPHECPEPGWVSERHGHSAWCTPRTCRADGDCVGGGSCVEVDRCWEQSTYGSGRRRWDEERDGPRPTAWRAQSRCNDGACVGESTCRTQRECVYPEGTSLQPVWRREDPPPTPEPEPEPEPEPAVEPTPEPESEPPATMETEATTVASSNEEDGCSLASTSPMWWVFLLFVRRRT